MSNSEILYSEDSKKFKSIFIAFAILFYVGGIISLIFTVLTSLNKLPNQTSLEFSDIFITCLCWFCAIYFNILAMKSKFLNYSIEISPNLLLFTVKGKSVTVQLDRIETYEIVKTSGLYTFIRLNVKDDFSITIFTKKIDEVKRFLSLNSPST